MKYTILGMQNFDILENTKPREKKLSCYKKAKGYDVTQGWSRTKM